MKKEVLFVQGGGRGAYAADERLAASLRSALGSGYDVHYPRMPNEGSPDYATWKRELTSELRRLQRGELVLVGHSLGGSILLKALSEEPAGPTLRGLFLLATPYWGGDAEWTWPDVHLPDDAAAKLASIPRITFFHGRDDEIVPFAHLARYAAKFPQAMTRELENRGHQLRNDLTDVAAEIREVTLGART